MARRRYSERSLWSCANNMDTPSRSSSDDHRSTPAFPIAELEIVRVTGIVVAESYSLPKDTPMPRPDAAPTAWRSPVAHHPAERRTGPSRWPRRYRRVRGYRTGARLQGAPVRRCSLLPTAVVRLRSPLPCRPGCAAGLVHPHGEDRKCVAVTPRSVHATHTRDMLPTPGPRVSDKSTDPPTRLGRSEICIYLRR